jgi:rubredoxin
MVIGSLLVQKCHFNLLNGLSVALRLSKYTFCYCRITIVPENDYKVWMCIICGWVYEEEKGCPEEGLAPGTRWEDIPEFWVCPDCGVGKEDFEMLEL